VSEPSVQSSNEAGHVRLVNVNTRSLDEFKAIVQSLLPADGVIRGLEVYIGRLTMPQLNYIFELLSANESDSIENLLFWKVIFKRSACQQLEHSIE